MRWRWIAIIGGCVCVHLAFCLLYDAIPWKQREQIYRAVPSFDRFYMNQAFDFWRMWDRLGWTGKDAAVECDVGLLDSFYVGGEPQGEMQIEVLSNRAFRVGYSEKWRSPLWVAYRLDRVEEFKWGRRPSSFRVEKRVDERVSAQAFSGSGYDRGHMAPNFGIATRYGREAQLETFVMSNVIAQRPWLNRGIWRRLEVDVARIYAQQEERIWILTGPIFSADSTRLRSGAWVPDACYKICVDRVKDRIRVMAFIMEQSIPPYTRLRERLVSVDEIEALTGIDFFPALASEAEITLEAAAATRLWPGAGPLVWF